MDEDDIFPPFFVLELADGFKERLAFDISDSAAHLDDGDLRILRGGIAVEAAFDLIGNVWDDLDRAPAKVSAPFFLEHRPVDLPGRDVGILCQALVDETLIVSQVQVCLSPVVCDEHFPVLDRVHCARVDIDVRVELLHGHCVSPCLQKTSQGSGCDPFPQSGYNAACYKYIFYCHCTCLLCDIIETFP